MPAEPAEHRAPDEGRDEAGATDALGAAEREQRAGERDDLQPRLRDEPAPAGDHDHACGQRPRERTEGSAVADLLEDEPDGVAVPDRPVLRLRDRERDEEERNAEAVVEPALDVEALPDPDWEARRRDDCLPESRVRRCEDDREDERLWPAEVTEEPDGDDEAEGYRQGKADSEEPRRYPERASQRAQVDARGVREQDDRERRLRE